MLTFLPPAAARGWPGTARRRHFPAPSLDAMGVVHSGRYVVLLERALAAYWAPAGWTYDPGHPRFAEVLFVVREFTITYHVPIMRTGTVHVQLWLDHLGTTSVVYGFRVLSDDGTVVHAEGRRAQVRIVHQLADGKKERSKRVGAHALTSWITTACLAREQRGEVTRWTVLPSAAWPTWTSSQISPRRRWIPSRPLRG